MIRRFAFVGVTTSQSAMVGIFPRWMEHLGLGDVQLVGHDLPLNAPGVAYRNLVTSLRDDPGYVGALVTSHKINLFQACRDLFAATGAAAARSGECSCLTLRDGVVEADSFDAPCAGRALDDIPVSVGFGQTSAEVLCLGAGGAGLALTLHLLDRPADRRPARITVVDVDRFRLTALRNLAGADSAGLLQVIHTAEPLDLDRAVGALPPESLVVNATGMGKDRPGSPITNDALFPMGGAAWDLNYRGELGFLQQARRQVDDRGIDVHDGWRHFVLGWAAVIERVFDIEIDAAELDRLSDLAESRRQARE